MINSINKQFWIFCIFTISFLWNGPLLFAQNLIPNPSFENWDGTSPTGLGGLDDWYNAFGTPDHHHSSITGNSLTGLSPCPLGQGNTECGYTVTGEAVLGCWKENGLDGQREWAGIQLTQPMTLGSCYQVSFWVQNKKDDPDNLFETNQWGIFFSETEFPTFGVNVIDYTSRLDQIVMTEEVIGDTIWHYYEFNYNANAPYLYAFVGYQGNVSTSTFTVANPAPTIGFYVWFDDVSIMEIETPELTVSADTTICSGDSVLISASSNYPVIWSHLSPDTISSIWASPLITSTFYVQTQDSTECSVIDSIVITVNNGEILEFPDSQIICLGVDAFLLEENSNDGFWSGLGIVDSETSLFDPDLTGEGSHEVFFISNNECSENFTLIIDVLDTPLLDIESDVNAGCAPLEVTFTDQTTIPGVSYLWDFDNGEMSNEIGSAATIYEDEGDYDITLSVTYSDYCDASISYNNLIQVGETPFVNFSYSPLEITNLNPRVQFDNLSSPNATTWSWDFGDGNFSSQLNPFYEFPQPGIYDVQLTVSTDEGCQDSLTQTLTVTNKIDFYIPNVFSPNGDGANDYFEVFPIGLIESYQITIFNRWGGTVFKSNELTNHWDGLIKGKLAQEGVYVYIIEYQFMNFVNGSLESGVLGGDVTIVK